MPCISIIVPVYNVEQYLPRCIDSILAQTFRDFELILVDDGSPDNCGAICDAYAEKDSRIHVIHQENRGQAAARNEGIKQARGQWVSFIDSDDCIAPYYMQVMHQTAAQNPKSIVGCSMQESEQFNSVIWKDSAEPRFQSFLIEESTMIELFKNPYVCWTVCSKLIPVQIAANRPFTNGHYFEDNAIMPQWLCDSGELVQSDAKMYFYQINQTGTTKGERSKKKQLDYLWALSEQLSLFCKNSWQILVKERMRSFLFMASDIYYSGTMQETGEAKKIAYTLWKVAKKERLLSKDDEIYIGKMYHPVWYRMKQMILRINK